jgi:hypothetical protein
MHFRAITEFNSTKINKNIMKGLSNYNGKNDNVSQIVTISFHDMTQDGAFDSLNFFNEMRLNINTVGIFNCNINAYSLKAMNEFLINLKHIKNIYVD